MEVLLPIKSLNEMTGLSGTEPSFRENPSEITLLYSRVRNKKEFRLLPRKVTLYIACGNFLCCKKEIKRERTRKKEIEKNL